MSHGNETILGRRCIVASIAPKDGELKYIHEEILGKTCIINHLAIGEIAFMRCFDGMETFAFHTSAVEDYQYDDKNNGFIIETKNTLYLFKICEEE